MPKIAELEKLDPKDRLGFKTSTQVLFMDRLVEHGKVSVSFLTENRDFPGLDLPDWWPVNEHGVIVLEYTSKTLPSCHPEGVAARLSANGREAKTFVPWEAMEGMLPAPEPSKLKGLETMALEDKQASCTVFVQACDTPERVIDKLAKRTGHPTLEASTANPCPVCKDQYHYEITITAKLIGKM